MLILQKICLTEMVKFSYPKTPFAKQKTFPKHFKIVGERCSGTYYIQRLIEHNFELPHTDDYGHKHFWSVRKDKLPEDLLVVACVREPISWVQSFFEKKWHVPEHFHDLSFEDFIQSEFYSIKDHSIPNIAGEVGSEIMADRNYLTDMRYQNLLDLRHHKMAFLFRHFHKMVNNMVVLRLEDVQANMDDVLSFLERKYYLRRKKEAFEDLKHYKGNSTLPIYTKKDIWLSDEQKELVQNLLNPTWEVVLDYRKSVK